MRRIVLVAGAWMVTTVFAAVVAWAAVGFVDDSVSADVDLPLSAAEVEEISAARVTTTAASPTTLAPTTTIARSTTTSAAPTTPTTAPAAATTSTSPPPPTAATTSPSQVPATTHPTATSSTTTTTTTLPASSEQTKAIRVDGGSVVVRWSAEGGVRLTSATPDQGWSVDIEYGGPPTVEVKFEGPDDVESELHVEVTDGMLKVEVGD